VCTKRSDREHGRGRVGIFGTACQVMISIWNHAEKQFGEEEDDGRTSTPK
jgi:hypothetical protein